MTTSLQDSLHNALCNGGKKSGIPHGILMSAEKERRLDVLKKTSSPHTFQQESKKLLILFPDFEFVCDLLQIAYDREMDKKKQEGGCKLIARFNAIKNALKQNRNMSYDDKKNIIIAQYSN